MNTKVAKNFLIVTVIGIAYYFVHVNLVGIAAAVAMPDWYIPFARENKALSLILFAMVTTVPAAALAAVVAGFSITKFVSDHRVWWCVSVVICITIYSVMTAPLDGGFLDSLK